MDDFSVSSQELPQERENQPADEKVDSSLKLSELASSTGSWTILPFKTGCFVRHTALSINARSLQPEIMSQSSALSCRPNREKRTSYCEYAWKCAVQQPGLNGICEDKDPVTVKIFCLQYKKCLRHQSALIHNTNNKYK